MIKSVLVVCIGNICRSPVGERLLLKYVSAAQPSIKVHSAGQGALVGHPADPTAAQVALKHGLSLDGHVARQFTNDLGRESDLILVMEQAHKSRIIAHSPELTGKIMLFDLWTGAEGILDPYRLSEDIHEQTYLKIDAAAAAWAAKLGGRGAS